MSCRRRGINPQDYLTDVLRRLPSITINRADPYPGELEASPAKHQLKPDRSRRGSH